MLSSQATHPSDFIAAFDLLAKGEASTTPLFSAREPSSRSALSDPILVPSIAETAGLNRFVYIIGLSEHRYVFSSINKSQISLYSEAVFVVIDDSRFAPLWAGDYSTLIAHLNNAHTGYSPRIYVHLLAEGDLAKSHVISDLSRSVDERACWKYSAA